MKSYNEFMADWRPRLRSGKFWVKALGVVVTAFVAFIIFQLMVSWLWAMLAVVALGAGAAYVFRSGTPVLKFKKPSWLEKKQRQVESGIKVPVGVES